MHVRILLAVARRVLTQLRNDPRSIAMIVVVPSFLLVVVRFLYDNETLQPGQPATFDRVGPILLGIFPFVVMFLITSITMLRERTSGTLERLLASPLGKGDLLFGYGLAFSLMAVLQAAFTCGVAYWLLGMTTEGSPWLVVLVAVVNAVLGVSLGLLCSAFAHTEFQAVQFMPVVVVPQFLLCGLLVARDQMADWLEAIANALPMTYSVEALSEISRHADPTGTMWRDLGIVAGCAVVALSLAAVTLPRASR
ncbi:ABC transporter permease [Saxibacter everestensis]|uniref:Transport permease protein n=1 Tax=Saxibacter everestensis TaxID=2909229 RepID=A0ABY8QSN6_9MICO|nr:ABC transporter permease [Brevibacteriaceae bacterium ZFBP1038]